jgi:hypothetical protein
LHKKQQKKMSDTKNDIWSNLIRRQGGRLEPAERISEVIFGLIMVLTFTCTMSAATSAREEVRTVLWAALGCNVAWGIIDSFFYLFSVLMSRGQGIDTVRFIRQAKNDKEASDVISDALPPLFSNLMTEDQFKYLRAEIQKLPEPPKSTGITWFDLWGAFNVFLLVFLSTFPVAIPFIFIQDVIVAMRVSNGVALVQLFIAGVYFGKQTKHSPFLSGMMIMGIGVLLVAMTIALGG